MKTLKLLCVLLATATLGACGVRGRPTPPETPPPLGRGEPNFSKATEKVTLPPKKKRKNINDWNETDDFQEGE